MHPTVCIVESRTKSYGTDVTARQIGEAVDSIQNAEQRSTIRTAFLAAARKELYCPTIIINRDRIRMKWEYNDNFKINLNIEPDNSCSVIITTPHSFKEIAIDSQHSFISALNTFLKMVKK
jgi:hypothetical protein